MFQLAQNGSCAYTHRSKFLFDFPRTIHPIWMSCTLSSFPGWQNLKKLNKTKSGTYSLGAISKIILGLHILLWRPEIRPRIALRLRANLVLLGRRRWKRFLEYWEGKTLQNFFYSSSSYFQCLSFLQFLSHFYFNFYFYLNFHCYIYFDFFAFWNTEKGKLCKITFVRRECRGLSKILLHRAFDQVDFVQMHFMHETPFLL